MSTLNWIKNLFISAWKQFLAAAIPAVKAEILGALKDIALQAVAEAAASDMSNEEKRILAFRKIKEYAVARGITAKDHLIDLAVSLAYSAFKGA